MRNLSSENRLSNIHPIATRMSTWLSILFILLAVNVAKASPKNAKSRKHHWEITIVAAKASVDPTLASLVTGIVTTQLAKAIASQPALATQLPADADPTKPELFRKQLQQAGITEAHRVSVDITAATEELIAVDGKAGEFRLKVSIAIHLLGEKRADKVISFAGEGSSTIIQDVGKKLRPNDRTFAWTSVIDSAITDAIATSLTKLAASPAAATKKPRKK